MNKPVIISKAMREVWAWKEASYREVAHLPVREALREIMRRAEVESRALGFTPSAPRKPLIVAEAPGKYAVKRKK